MTHKILLADDTADLRELLAEVISIHLGDETEIVQCANGALAIEAIKSAAEPFGLVMTDLCMPEANGFDVLSAAFEAGISNALLMTGTPPDPDSPEQQIMTSLKEGGMNLRFVVKPVSPCTVYQLLDEVFGND